LAGVQRVTLLDVSVSSTLLQLDLSANCFLTPSVVATVSSSSSSSPTVSETPRLTAVLPQLRQLNDSVAIATAAHLPQSDAEWSAFHVVVVAGIAARLLGATRDEIAARCHRLGVKFVLADAPGAFGAIFCDFGAQHIVNDATGERVSDWNVLTVTGGGTDGCVVVQVVDTGRVALEDSGEWPDRVSLADVRGAAGAVLNALPPQRVRLTGPFSFELPDVPFASLGGAHEPYSGVVRQVFAERTYAFQSLAESSAAPRFESIAGAVTRDAQLHALYRSLLAEPVTVPGTTSGRAIADRVVRAAAANAADTPLFADAATHDWLVRAATASVGYLPSVTSFVGGVAAQEVMKAITGQYVPIRQWFYYDGTDALPFTSKAGDNDFIVQAGDTTHVRQQAGLMATLGRQAVHRLAAVRPLVVGAGAIGCELLKNLAVLGVQRARVIDMDSIERSNLSRQFLFRNEHVGQLKSATASAAVQAMRPSLSVEAFSQRVGRETEEMYNADFYAGVDIVMNALDNVEARNYVDSQCVFYKLPLMEGGTLGPKGNTQAVVPHLTESYAASQAMDPRETRSFPACTLHHFPTNIEHTLVWARDKFSLLFDALPRQAQLYAAGALAPPQADGLVVNVAADAPPPTPTVARCTRAFAAHRTRSQWHSSFADALLLPTQLASVDDADTVLRACVEWAMQLAYRWFVVNVEQLLARYPPDHVEKGEPFWRAPRRAPTVLALDAADDDYVTFVAAAAALRAQTCAWAPCLELGARARHCAQPPTGQRSPRRRKPPRAQCTFRRPRRLRRKSLASRGGSDDDSCQQCVGRRGPGARSGACESADAGDAAFAACATACGRFRQGHAGCVWQEWRLAGATPASVGSIEFVAAAANLRARAYGVTTVDLLEARRIAGGIVPALVTTTAAVAGWQVHEMIKWIVRPQAREQGEAALARYKNGFMNLALPFFAQIEPVAPATNELREGSTWTVWDSIDVEGGQTLRELIEWIEENQSVEVSMVSAGAAMLYTTFTAAHKARLAMTIEAIYQQVVLKDKPLPSHAALHRARNHRRSHRGQRGG
jgi:ubiquitin-activating enzyme E1